jgi:peptidyl-prolyl cis-trans isomerase C
MSSATRITKSKKLKNEMSQLEESNARPSCLEAIPIDSIPGAVKGRKASSLIRCLREPLAQFLLIGFVLFLAYGAFNRGAGQTERSYQIALTTDDMRQLQNTFTAQWQRAPSPEEMHGLVEQKIRDEILYRQALQLGLDKDDVIIKRRLAQKMQFLAEDIGGSHQPTRAELRAWYEKNSARFALPSRFSFRHLYFSPDRRGQQAQDEAIKALAKIREEPEESKAAAALADRFMFQDYYADRTQEELEKEFGARFASEVPKLKPGSWQGPVESGYGWHLVFVDSVIPGLVPVFEEVEYDVKTAWLADQKQQTWQKAYEDMRSKYTILLPSPASPQSASLPSKTPPIPAPSGEGLQ